MKPLSLTIALALATACAYAFAQEPLKPFTSVCIEEQATGFNWSNGQWTRTTFNSDRFLLEKVDYERAQQARNPVERPMLCKPEKVTALDANNYVAESCYSVRAFGEKRELLNMRMCQEAFTKGSLFMITCPDGRFLPDGNFVKLPDGTSMTLQNEGQKPSMVLSVGKCAVISP